MLVCADICGALALACSISHFRVVSSLSVYSPAREVTGAPPPCCTCVIILAAGPATAITYVNESSGLEPSVYGGGGSESSALLLEGSALVSKGRAALVSASTLIAPVGATSTGGAGQKGDGGKESGSVTAALKWSVGFAVAESSEEKGGGARDCGVEEDAGRGSVGDFV